MNEVLDKGHRYELLSLDDDEQIGNFTGRFYQTLTFVKRCDLQNPERFPGNENAYPGTTVQSVVRALLERLRYLQNQIWSLENVFVIFCLRCVLWLMEFRAARRHGHTYWKSLTFAETEPLCQKCGHTICEHDKT